jgi:hypothetical protein
MCVENQLTDEQIREALQPIIDLMIARRQTIGSLWAYDDERPTPKIVVPEPGVADECELDAFCSFLDKLDDEHAVWDVLRTVFSQFTPTQFRELYRMMYAYERACTDALERDTLD